MGALVALAIDFSARLAQWAATKLFFAALLMVGLPFVLKGVINWAFSQISSFIISILSTTMPSLSAPVLSLSGISAWMFQQSNLSTAIAIVLSAVATRLILNFIPFVK